MSKKLDQIFDECVERMLWGESIESCLARYPEVAAELETMLRTVFHVGRVSSSLQADPGFKARTRYWLGAQASARNQGQQAQRGKYGPFGWRPAWAVSLATIFVLLVTGAGTVAAASDALPDERLYAVKLATEQARLTFTFSDAAKSELHTRLAESRATEIVTMASEGKTQQVLATTRKLATHLAEATSASARPGTAATPSLRATGDENNGAASVPAPAPAPGPVAAPTPGNVEAAKVKKTARSLTVILESALQNTPEATRAALQQAIDVSRQYESPQPGPRLENRNGTGTNTRDGGKSDTGAGESQPQTSKDEADSQAKPGPTSPAPASPSPARPTPVSPAPVAPPPADPAPAPTPTDAAPVEPAPIKPGANSSSATDKNADVSSN